mgnify:CR=1 FL=1
MKKFAQMLSKALVAVSKSVVSAASPAFLHSPEVPAELKK